MSYDIICSGLNKQQQQRREERILLWKTRNKNNNSKYKREKKKKYENDLQCSCFLLGHICYVRFVRIRTDSSYAYEFVCFFLFMFFLRRSSGISFECDQESCVNDAKLYHFQLRFPFAINDAWSSSVARMWQHKRLVPFLYEFNRAIKNHQDTATRTEKKNCMPRTKWNETILYASQSTKYVSVCAWERRKINHLKCVTLIFSRNYFRKKLFFSSFSSLVLLCVYLRFTFSCSLSDVFMCLDRYQNWFEDRNE